jgi:predicted DNA-binding transcriptional regulator AlpA
MDVTSKQSRIIRMRDLPSKVGFQPSTIYELISKGKFPTPHKLVPGGRAAGWFEATIDDWMARQAERPQDGTSK